MTELFRNLARSTLASGITAGALSLTVQSGDGNDLFPAPGASDEFRALLFKKATGDVEIITVSARTADVFTIARAQENIGNIAATAFAFDAGDLVELRPTSAFFTNLAAGATSSNIQHGTFLYGVDTGAADVYTVAMTPTATTISDGQEVRVKIGAGNTNTGIAATLQLDAITAGPITMEGGGNPPANSIRAGFVHTFNWDGTSFIFKPAGLALTSSGFDALGKQIKNLVAGTAASDAATIGLAETLVNKDSVEMTVLGTTHAGSMIGTSLFVATGLVGSSFLKGTVVTLSGGAGADDEVTITSINETGGNTNIAHTAAGATDFLAISEGYVPTASNQVVTLGLLESYQTTDLLTTPIIKLNKTGTGNQGVEWDVDVSNAIYPALKGVIFGFKFGGSASGTDILYAYEKGATKNNGHIVGSLEASGYIFGEGTTPVDSNGIFSAFWSQVATDTVEIWVKGYIT